MSDNGRLPVRKTYKLYLGGKFPRSESGRSYEVTDADGAFVANAARASRKDVRDAVVAARKAFAGWSGATAYNRGQILYRVAEVMEGRRDQFVAEVSAADGADGGDTVDAAIDRWVWYAGWTDKIASVAGSANPVAGPYFTFRVPEPTGVVAVVAPQESSLLGLVSVLAPALAAGNTTVVVASQQRPVPAITLSEVLATSDVPGGVVNLLTGSPAGPRSGLAHGRQRHRPVRGARRARHRARSRRRGEPETGPAPRRRGPRLDGGPRSGSDAGADRDEDRLAPRRRVIAHCGQFAELLT
jgi:acyl-CoA reductase-like NAD-dependent aldehyde dehydrogenase